MKNAIVLFFILLASLTWAQSPTLTGLEVTGQTDLQAQLNWNAVSGATYSVYRYKDYSCSPAVKWVELATGLSSTSYTDIPPNLGPYCYTVTATVAGVESSFSNIVVVRMGNHWYWYVKYRLADCLTPVATPPGVTLSITELRNGVQSILPVTLLGTDTFYGTSRFYDDATYSAILTLPSGKIINYPGMILGTGQPISSATDSNWHTTFISGSDQWCRYEQDNNFQPATNN